MENFDLIKYLNNNLLLESEDSIVDKVVDEIDDEMDLILKSIESELKKKSTEDNLNEGFMTIVGVGLALPAILGIVAKIGKKAGQVISKMVGKKPTDKDEVDKWFNRLSKIADELHHLYMVPLESLMSKFIKDKKKAKKAAHLLFHVIIAIFLISAGTTAVKAFQAKNISLTTLEGVLTAIKSGELTTFIGNALEIASESPID
jgi:hypothetical protein